MPTRWQRRDHHHREASRYSVSSPPRIVCAGSSLLESNVRPNVGVTARLPPCKPCVSARFPPTDHDEVRNPQRKTEHKYEREASVDFHCSAPSGAIDLQCKRRSCRASSSWATSHRPGRLGWRSRDTPPIHSRGATKDGGLTTRRSDMLRRTAAILMLPTLVLLSGSCRRIPAHRTHAIPREAMVPSTSIPANWGNLVGVTSAANYPELVQLWFQDNSGGVRLVVFSLEENELLNSSLIPRR